MERMSQQPTTKDLRQFGLFIGGVFAVIGLWPLVFRSESPRLWAMILGGLLIILGAIVPQSLKQVHGGWMKIGHILGSINTKIILGIIYYLLITPMGLAMRLMGKDPLHRALAQGSDTYRVVRAPRPGHHMRNQFQVDQAIERLFSVSHRLLDWVKEHSQLRVVDNPRRLTACASRYREARGEYIIILECTAITPLIISKRVLGYSQTSRSVLCRWADYQRRQELVWLGRCRGNVSSCGDR